MQVSDSADVRAVVALGDRYDVPLVARSGGHGYNGDSTSATAVVVDLDALDRISYRDGTRHARPGRADARRLHRARAPRRDDPRRQLPDGRPSAGSCSAAGWGSPAARSA